MAEVPSSKNTMNRRLPGALKAKDRAKVPQARHNLGRTVVVGTRSTMAKVGMRMVDKAISGGRTNRKKKTAMLGPRAKLVSLGTSNRDKTRTRMLVDSGHQIGIRSKQTRAMMAGVVLRLIPTVGTKRKAAHGTKTSQTKIGGAPVKQPNHGQIVETLGLVASGPNMTRQIPILDEMHMQSKMQGAGQISPVMIVEVTLGTKVGAMIPGGTIGTPAK